MSEGKKEEVRVADVKVLNEALDFLDGVCAQVKVNREMHFQVQSAVKVLRDKVNRKEGEGESKRSGEASSGEDE